MLKNSAAPATTLNNGVVRLVYTNEDILTDINNEPMVNIEPVPYEIDLKPVIHCCVKNKVYAPRLPSPPQAESACDFPLTAYPNPANNNKEIRIPYNEGSEVVSVELFDTYGKCISTQLNIDSKSYLVQPANTLHGIYILHIHTTNCTFTQKIIIQ